MAAVVWFDGGLLATVYSVRPYGVKTEADRFCPPLGGGQHKAGSRPLMSDSTTSDEAGLLLAWDRAAIGLGSDCYWSGVDCY